jgi:hypothetical protein
MSKKNDLMNEEIREPEIFEKKEINKDEIEIVFTENRSFDLHIGDIVYHFAGQSSVKVPKSVLVHKDWTEEISKYFIVR